MSDHTFIPPLEPEPIAVSTETPSQAPAVHDSTLWDGERELVSLPDDVGVISTKQQYWDVLNRLGLQMKNQQESTTGPDRGVVAWLGAEPAKERPIRHFTRDEAEAMCAGLAVLMRQRIRDTVWCQQCALLGRPSGTRTRTTDSYVLVECRCGKREYRPPMGATDLPTRLANIAETSDNQTHGHIDTPNGQIALPAFVLENQEARALLAYRDVLTIHNLASRLFCDRCWDHETVSEEKAMRLNVDDGEILLLCNCRLRYWRAVRH